MRLHYLQQCDRLTYLACGQARSGVVGGTRRLAALPGSQDFRKTFATRSTMAIQPCAHPESAGGRRGMRPAASALPLKYAPPYATIKGVQTAWRGRDGGGWEPEARRGVLSLALACCMRIAVPGDAGGWVRVALVMRVSDGEIKKWLNALNAILKWRIIVNARTAQSAWGWRAAPPPAEWFILSRWGY